MYYGAVTGTGFSVIMALHADPRLSYAEIAGRHLVKVAFPYVVTATTFGLTTSILDEVRGKDKPISNAFLGGGVAGLVLACTTHSPYKVAHRTFLFAALGAFTRFIVMNCGYVYDPQAQLDRINNSLYMSNLEHLKQPIQHK